jgi:hypothetical protein
LNLSNIPTEKKVTGKIATGGFIVPYTRTLPNGELDVEHMNELNKLIEEYLKYDGTKIEDLYYNKSNQACDPNKGTSLSRSITNKINIKKGEQAKKAEEEKAKQEEAKKQTTKQHNTNKKSKKSKK